jgi:hypothetical protein
MNFTRQKHILVLILILFITIISPYPSCAEKTTLQDVQKELGEATDAIRDYSIEQRDNAVRKVKPYLEALDARIEHMEKRLNEEWNSMSEAARDQATATLTALRKKRYEVAEWYGGMKVSSARAWEHVKQGFSEAFQSLDTALDQAEREF